MNDIRKLLFVSKTFGRIDLGEDFIPECVTFSSQQSILFSLCLLFISLTFHSSFASRL